MRQGPLPADALLERLVEGTASETGEAFFRRLVADLCEALAVHGAWIAEILPGDRRLRALALRLGSDWVEGYEYDVPGTPCGAAIARRDVLLVNERVAELFPGDNDLVPLGAVSYIGSGFFDGSGQRLLGLLAVLHTRPLADPEACLRVFRVFAARAGAELRRLHLERELRARNEELDAILSSALDAIVILDGGQRVARVNEAAARLLGPDDPLGKPFAAFGDDAGAASPGPWLPGGMRVRASDGRTTEVEGTRSSFTLRGETFTTLILRDLTERREAEARVEALERRSAYLREEVEDPFSEILGDSPAIRALLRDLAEVAPTDASVLIDGETGTGKELVARAVHRASPRRDAPLIKVNCAAIPEALIESEFFGHEKGAFTGATARREGRFALADRGTLFLDEIGELPLPLQAKLLRVLQEGEFEPVGGARTRKVDVRIVAASNRDLRAEVAAGRFREDLYYRLSVFPLHVPALRRRGADVERLAEAFVARFCRRYGRPAPTLSDDDRRRLRAYRWPGNVRELQNVVERALLVGGKGGLALTRALAVGATDEEAPAASPTPPGERPILSAAELAALERENTARALAAAKGRVGGPGGAAALLGVKPTTLRSRVKALGLASTDDEVSSPPGRELGGDEDSSGAAARGRSP